MQQKVVSVYYKLYSPRHLSQSKPLNSFYHYQNMWPKVATEQILFLSSHGRPYRLSSISMMPMIYHLWIRDEWNIVPQVESWTLYQTPTSRSEATAASASKITELEPRDDALLSTCIYEYRYRVKGLNILRSFSSATVSGLLTGALYSLLSCVGTIL